MIGRSRSPVDQTGKALGSTLDDVKAGAKAGAVKGMATGALSVLGAKAAGAAQSAMSSNGDVKDKARKAQTSAGKKLAQAVATAGKQARSAGKKADVEDKAAAGSNLLQMLGKRTQEATQTITSDGVNINIDINDVPRLLRGLALVATGLGTLFAPGSALDVSNRMDADLDQITDQARQGIDAATNLTQQRIKDVVDAAKDALASLSDALTEGIETAEKQAQRALEETETRLTQAAGQAAGAAKKSLPKKRGGSLRWLFYGLLLGGTAAFLSSPFSGVLGERIMNLRRDLGLGGDGDADSQYWPSSSQQSATTAAETTASPEASAPAGEPPADTGAQT